MPPRIPRPNSKHFGPSPQPSICLRCLYQQRQFSGTPVSQLRVPKVNRMRRAMYAWFDGPGAAFREPLAGSTNYLGAYDRSGNLLRGTGAPPGREDEEGGGGDKEMEKEKADEKDSARPPPETASDLKPFPLNHYFRSEPVLSESLRDEIYLRVRTRGQTVREVSAALSVTMERVAAVVRMKEIQSNWDEEEASLLEAYQKVVMNMLPQTRFKPGQKVSPNHESINDLPVHSATLIQMFHPTSESRHFTRIDAGRVFHPRLLPADDRIPHPEMVDAARDYAEGYTQSARATRMQQRYDEIEEKSQRTRLRAEAAEQARTKIVAGKRWDFRFRDINADAAGRDGRGRGAVGWRYGQPVEDRKKGQKKIPLRVE